ncbi:CAP domain-containing protein [Chytriomyces cf. hyalinus JEL632]|nr:CAP domain-containing protein [Chytriomyces cf. hyalinus JEL632]
MRISILVISITAACVMAAPKRKCKVHSNPQVSSTTAVPQAVPSSVAAASNESLIFPEPVVVQNSPAAAVEQAPAEETVTNEEEAPAQADAPTTETQAPAPAPQAEAEDSNAPAPAPQEEVEPAPAPAPQAQVEEAPAPAPAPAPQAEVVQQQQEQPQKQVAQAQAQTGTATGVTGMSATDDQAMLAAHNAFRASNGIGPLQYDSAIALHSVSWAKVLASQGCNLVHGDHDGLGQNLYMSSGTSTPRNSMQEMFDAWSSEDISPGGALNHATQALWPKTTKVGCAIAWGTSRNGWQCEVLVCNYSPPGNYVGKYWADV